MNKDIKETLSELKTKGRRFSAVRNFILNALDKNDKPLSVSDFQNQLEIKKMKANKVTIYRELDFLKREGIISEIQLKGDKRWYELAERKHHHHVICTKCSTVKDFINNDSEKIIDKIAKNVPGFAKITNHSFELFGLCKSCAKK